MPRRPRAHASGFATQIRETVAARRISSSSLAAAAGVDRRHLSRFLAGSKDVTLTTAYLICAALGLRLTEAPARKSPTRAAVRPADAEPETGG